MAASPRSEMVTPRKHDFLSLFRNLCIARTPLSTAIAGYQFNMDKIQHENPWTDEMCQSNTRPEHLEESKSEYHTTLSKSAPREPPSESPQKSPPHSHGTRPSTMTHEDSSSESEDFVAGDLCEDCRTRNGDWYCGACTQRYCEPCWKRRPGHKKRNPDSVNHMKVSYTVQ